MDKENPVTIFCEYNVIFRKKVLAKSRKYAVKPIRYTHLIGGLYHAELLQYYFKIKETP